MINAIPLGQSIEFKLPYDKENPTIWILGAIDSITKMEMFSVLAPIEKTEKSEDYSPRISPLQFNLELVRFGLKGFKNFMFNKQDVEFKTEKISRYGKTYQVASDETLGKIPMRVLNLLADEILKIQEVTEEERKNS